MQTDVKVDIDELQYGALRVYVVNITLKSYGGHSLLSMVGVDSMHLMKPPRRQLRERNLTFTQHLMHSVITRFPAGATGLRETTAPPNTLLVAPLPMTPKHESPFNDSALYWLLAA